MKISEKLEHFAEDIMADVNKKEQKIVEEINKEYDEIYNKKETEYLTKAYEIIQRGLKDIDKEKNEIISKTMMNNKIKLLNKRNEIIQNVFDMTKDKLVQLTKSEAYHDYLFKMIEENIAVIGEGDLEITVNHTDKSFKEEIEEKFNCKVKIESEKVELIGGCKILNLSNSTFLDDTFVRRLQSNREEFIKDCKINIEM